LKIAIVILNYNGEQLLADFMPSVVAHSQRDDTEIWLVDNCSTDDSIGFVKKTFPTVQILVNESNLGFAKGYNQSLKNIPADIYCLLNSDVEVTEGWLKPIIDSFIKNDHTTVIQPKILDYNNKSKFEYAGAAGGFIDRLGYAFCRGRMFNQLESDKGQYNDSANIFWASGACFFIRSKIFHQLNGFDEEFFAHYEEIDLCWRIQNKNLGVLYEGTSEVYHLGGGTLNKQRPKKTYLNFRNSLLTLVKNLPLQTLLYLIPLRFLLDVLAAIQQLALLKPAHSFAILKANVDFLLLLPRMLKKKDTLPKRKDYYYTNSIVWKYFLLNAKRFEDL
jgi:GT2 family glycosyltransferase